MNLQKKKYFVLMLFVVFAQTLTLAQSKKTNAKPSITYQEVIDNYYKALGGKKKFSDMKNQLMKASIKIETKVSGKTTKMNTKSLMAFDKKGRYLMLTGDESGFQMKIYFDGKDGYTYMNSLKTKTPFDKNTLKLYKNLSSQMLADPKERLGDILPKVTKDSIGSKAYHVVQSITESNNMVFKSKMYFDIETGLLFANFTTGSGSNTEMYFLDYKDINGFLTAMHTVTKSDLGNGNSTMISNVYQEYSYNGFIDSYFTTDDSVSAQQINSITSAEERHQNGLALLNTSLGLSTGDAGAIDSGTIANTDSKTYIPGGNNLRDIAYKEILESKEYKTSNTGTTANSTVNSEGKKVKVKELQDEYNDFEDLKYRRSSLYTMMINDPSRERNSIVRNAFGNTELSTKFNNHNIGPYLIPGEGGEKDQTAQIEEYLNSKGVAKELVAKWFNRDSDGNFDMELVANRGQYNASDLNVKIANSSKRGAAILKDAGEELIGNTFVIVYDYKYTNKEESAKKRKGWLNAISTVASLAGYDDVATIADGTSIASDVVGKGYFVRTTSYLYRLVWDEETANTFYAGMWVDKDNPDPSKKKAFDKTNMFKLKYVGSEISRTNLQSTIFTTKSNNQLIEIATTKAVDKNIGKLQRKFEEFRVKTPLLSGDPIAAKIGTKEGLEKGDKFEVLEQYIDEDGITSYERVGVIKVDHRNIWDNGYLAKEEEEAKKNPEPKAEKKGILSSLYGTNVKKEKSKKSMFSSFSKKKKDKKKKTMFVKEKPEQKSNLEYTLFTGKKGKFASGMLIRQIN